MNTRIYFVFSGFLLLWALVVGRGFLIQIFPDERITSLKARQYTTSLVLSERRGNITDRSGREVAFSMSAFSLFADPQLIERPHSAASKLAKVLRMPPKNIYEKLTGDKRFVWLARQLSVKDKALIDDLKIKGLGFLSDYRRIYPDDNLFEPIIGATGYEGQGLEGAEFAYDRELIGTGRKIILGRDARGRPLLTPGVVEENTSENEEIQLTLDSQIQHFLNRELEETKQKFNADQAMGLVLDAKTSGILAAVQLSDLDSKGDGSRTRPTRNRLISDVYEPGSTLKPFTIAAGLVNKKITPTTRFNTENGFFQIGRHIIREAETKDKWPSLNVAEILAYSSNIGTSKIALSLGDEMVMDTLHDFGFGNKTGIDLPGESKGLISSLPWNEHLLANVSFGQGIAVTPLQLASAYATIANDGVFQKPHILNKIKNLKTNTEELYALPTPRRVVSSEVAKLMRGLLEGVTTWGTGKSARVDGFGVAGKTGTAQKASADARGYSADAYVSSFAGFLPANDPSYVVLIIVDHPKKGSHFGAQVAAPVFARVGSFLMRKEGRSPFILSQNKSAAKKLRISPRSPASSGKDVSLASAGTAPSDIDTSNNDSVPYLKGLTMREVLSRLKGKNVQVSFQGEGVVSDTVPAEGGPLQDLKIYLK